MKRILGIAMVLGSLAFIAGCSKEKAPQIKAESASEKFEKDVTGEPTKEKAPQVKNESASEKSETASNERGITKEPTKKISSGKEEVIDLGKDVKLGMVLVPSGKFMMGFKKNPVDPFSNIEVEQPPQDELPQHEVTLTKPFYMSKYEVTQEQWFEIMGENPSEEKGRKLPVTNVSWGDCREFIKKLNAKTNGGYRLPTEAEWEYACRAGTTSAYSFGDKITPKDANIFESKIDKPVVVGSYKPNAFGLYDMHGNVWEWCEDWNGYYPKGSVTDPKGPKPQNRRVSRGGSFYHNLLYARSSSRDGNSPSDTNHKLGFRLARTAEPEPEPAGVTKAKEIQKGVAKSLQKEVEEKTDLGIGIKLDLVLIPAGKFKMGSPESEDYRMDNETQHEVTLTKPFYMGKFEVTQEQWEAVMGNNPSSRTKGAKLPVTDVSWEECQEFIEKLNDKTKGGYRLPTEAEFEYSCRAGTSTAYSFGDSLSKSDANFTGKSIKEVGSYNSNAFGLYDIHGNVAEWCEDWYGDYPVGAVTDPKGPATGESRVLRGGSFYSNESKARSSGRYRFTPTTRYDSIGFRLARTK